MTYAIPDAQENSPAWRRRLGRLAGVVAVGGALLLGTAPQAAAAGPGDGPTCGCTVVNTVFAGPGSQVAFEFENVTIDSISLNGSSGDNSPISGGISFNFERIEPTLP